MNCEPWFSLTVWNINIDADFTFGYELWRLMTELGMNYGGWVYELWNLMTVWIMGGPPVAGLISATKISVIVFLLLGFSCYRKLWPLFRCYFCSMPLYDYTQYTKMASKSLISTQILFPKNIFRYEKSSWIYMILDFQKS